MPSNVKADNQYFGKYFERALVEHINQTNVIVDPTLYVDTQGYNFSTKEIEDLNNDAILVADYIGHNIHATRVGDHTASEIGDILLDDGTRIETKRVSSGTGTYHNTSVYYFTAFNFNFQDYMTKFHLQETIKEYFPNITVSYKNKSPVNAASSSTIRHSNNPGYQEILQIDEAMRKTFVMELIKYFQTHPTEAQIFYKDMLEKKKINQKNNTMPNRLIAYNYQNKQIHEVNLLTLKDNPSAIIYPTDLGFCIGNLRIQIGWQNGNGLNNPTIRVFLK